jgi:hypothetical protein
MRGTLGPLPLFFDADEQPPTAICRPSMMKEVQNPHRSRKRQAHQLHMSNEVSIVASQPAITPMVDEVRAKAAARATQIEQVRCQDTDHPVDRRGSSLIRGLDRRIPSATHRLPPSPRAPPPRTYQSFISAQRGSTQCAS